MLEFFHILVRNDKPDLCKYLRLDRAVVVNFSRRKSALMGMDDFSDGRALCPHIPRVKGHLQDTPDGVGLDGETVVEKGLRKRLSQLGHPAV